MVRIRNAHGISSIGTKVERQGGIFEAIEPYARVVQQSGVKDMVPVERQSLHPVVQRGGGAGAESTVYVGKVGGIGCFGSGNRVVGEEAIFCRNIVVEPRLEGGLIEFVFSVEDEIIREYCSGNIRIRK